MRIRKGHVSKDHVHIQASCPPTISPAKLMKQIKGRSSRKVQQEFKHLRKQYWGQHFWARGYFCATVGRVTDEQIKAYIECHDQEPPDNDFTVEE